MIMDNRLLVARRKYDPDATRYINAVQLADGQALEPEVAMAIDAFVRGCKADNAGYAGDPTRTNWDAIKASCIMCGARTIAGALVPLVGAAPTAYSFASGDYSRTTGLKGDGATKYLDSNRNNNADPQDDQHVSVHVSTAATSTLTTNPVYISADDAASEGATHIGRLSNNGVIYTRSRQAGANFCTTGTGSETGLLALTRSSSSTYVVRRSGATVTPSAIGSRTSTTPFDGNVFVFGSTANYFSNARLAFYSIGSAISDLSLLDSRVTTLVSQIAAAIP